jgi:tRNA pseudouridine55 synthase
MQICKPDSLVHGILLLDKPFGLSSNAALQRVRRLFGRPTAGHTGSLDPLATGMLPICLGEATKVAGLMLGGRKAYETEIALGRRTSTGDAEGEVVEEKPVPELSRPMVEARLAALIGWQRQRPPMFSAVHVGGVRLYQLARRGIAVDRPVRSIEILDVELRDLAADRLSVRIVCSTGTYIRVLAEDIAQRLGTVGHVAGLHRLWVEPFEDAPMSGIHALENRAASGRNALQALVLPIERALVGLAEAHLETREARRLAQGQKVVAEGLPGLKAVYGPGRHLLGLGELENDGCLHARRLFTWAIDSMACAQRVAVESAPGRR